MQLAAIGVHCARENLRGRATLKKKPKKNAKGPARAKKRPAAKTAKRSAPASKRVSKAKRAAVKKAAKPSAAKSSKRERGVDLIYYAPGTGLSHLTRAIAVLRAWNRITKRSSVLASYSRYASLAQREGVRLRQLPGPNAQAIERLFRELSPKLLVVDTFPRGTVGELAEVMAKLQIPAVLVQRYVNPAYLRQYNVAAFVGQYYRLVIRIADALPPQTLSQRTIDVPPVTIRDAKELPHPLQRSGWLFLDWGEGEGSDDFLAVAHEEARRRGKEFRAVRRGEAYPAVELMPSFELVIAAGGYNVYHEAALTGTPVIFVPARRMYDDQFGRTVHVANARSPQALRSMLHAEPPAPPPPHDGSGAAQLVNALRQVLEESEKKPRRAAKGAKRR